MRIKKIHTSEIIEKNVVYPMFEEKACIQKGSLISVTGEFPEPDDVELNFRIYTSNDGINWTFATSIFDIQQGTIYIEIERTAGSLYLGYFMTEDDPITSPPGYITFIHND